MQHRISRLWKLFVRCLPVFGMLAMTARGQWNEAAWSQTNTFRNTNLWWAGVRTFTITNEVSPGVYAVTNDTFLSPIMASNYYGTNAVSGTWTERVLRWTNGTPTSFSYTVSSSVPLTQTNLTQGWRDQVNLDCYLAVKERRDALPYNDAAAYAADVDVRFYHDYRANLVNLKGAVASLFGFLEFVTATSQAYYVSAPVFSNLLSAGLYRTNIYQAVWNPEAVASVAFATNALLCSAGAAPSNYFNFTPYKSLFATSSVYRPVMTCLFTFGGPFSGTLAVTNMDCCGNTGVVVTATNYQTVAVVCTNASIASGYTSADYGFWPFRRVITNLQAIAHVGSEDVGGVGPWDNLTGTFTSRQFSAIGTSTVSAADAEDAAVASINGGTASLTGAWNAYPWESYLKWEAVGTTPVYYATAVVSSNKWRFGRWSTPFEHVVEWYASADVPDSGGTNRTFSDMGTGLAFKTNLVIYATNTVSPTNTFLLYEIVATAAKTNFPATMNEVRGMRANYPVWLSWPRPTTNGFKYR